MRILILLVLASLTSAADITFDFASGNTYGFSASKGQWTGNGWKTATSADGKSEECQISAAVSANVATIEMFYSTASDCLSVRDIAADGVKLGAYSARAPTRSIDAYEIDQVQWYTNHVFVLVQLFDYLNGVKVPRQVSEPLSWDGQAKTVIIGYKRTDGGIVGPIGSLRVDLATTAKMPTPHLDKIVLHLAP